MDCNEARKRLDRAHANPDQPRTIEQNIALQIVLTGHIHVGRSVNHRKPIACWSCHEYNHKKQGIPVPAEVI